MLYIYIYRIYIVGVVVIIYMYFVTCMYVRALNIGTFLNTIYMYNKVLSLSLFDHHEKQIFLFNIPNWFVSGMG